MVKKINWCMLWEHKHWKAWMGGNKITENELSLFSKKNRLYDVVVENDFYAWSFGGFKKQTLRNKSLFLKTFVYCIKESILIVSWIRVNLRLLWSYKTEDQFHTYSHWKNCEDLIGKEECSLEIRQFNLQILYNSLQ